MSGWQFWIDRGGTFTDIVVSTANGETIIAKAATTPADQSEGVLQALALAAERLNIKPGELLANTDRIVHGTTAATIIKEELVKARL